MEEWDDKARVDNCSCPRRVRIRFSAIFGGNVILYCKYVVILRYRHSVRVPSTYEYGFYLKVTNVAIR
jgi:hypothetical protein